MRSLLTIITLALLSYAPPAEGARVKDIASIYGIRDNTIFGYGLVTGLNRSGDSRRNEATIRALANRLQGLGFTISTDEILARNVAVVMVTARMPAGSRPGHRLDIEVSSSGDATSLEGGVLQITPLYAPNGQAYASAQGSLVVGGYLVSAGGSTARKNHPTVGSIPMGGTVERENPNRFDISKAERIEWLVNDPDFTTASRMSMIINDTFDSEIAKAMDGGTVVVDVPPRFADRVTEFVATVELLNIEVDMPARVVVNERTGTVVMGAGVTISNVAVAHGGLSIEVDLDSDVSQPGALSGGTTQVTRDSQIKVKEAGGELVEINGVTIGDLVNALNNIGVKPRDLIQILLTIRAAGAMQAELEVI